MSHVATVEIEIKDLDALDAACKAIGMELVRGQKTYNWYGKHVGDYPLPAGFKESDLGTCEHAIRIPGDHSDKVDAPYEIGVVRRRDGRPGFVLHWDFYSGGFGLQKMVGPDCGLLKQAYTKVVATRAAMQQGYRIQEQKMPNGAVRLVMTK